MARRAEAALYDERFCRMWEFIFRLRKPHSAMRTSSSSRSRSRAQRRTVPLTRTYIAEREQQLRAREAPLAESRAA
jgi:cyclopropane-fatty-acyl-phospholipid synthase